MPFIVYWLTGTIMSWLLIILLLMRASSRLVECQNIIEADGPTFLDSSNTLQCHTRQYTFRVTQVDENGRKCWDTLSVMACWGRCDSNEVSNIFNKQTYSFKNNYFFFCKLYKKKLKIHFCAKNFFFFLLKLLLHEFKLFWFVLVLC